MPTSTIPVIDAAQLHRVTRGNANLQVEVLSLFVAEVERLMRQIANASDGQVRGDRLKALIGSARNIGAALLVHEGRLLETRIADESPDLASLRAAVEATLSYIHQTGV